MKRLPRDLTALSRRNLTNQIHGRTLPHQSGQGMPFRFEKGEGEIDLLQTAACPLDELEIVQKQTSFAIDGHVVVKIKSERCGVLGTTGQITISGEIAADVIVAPPWRRLDRAPDSKKLEKDGAQCLIRDQGDERTVRIVDKFKRHRVRPVHLPEIDDAR